MIVSQFQQNRIIDDAAMLIGDQDIFGLTNGHVRQIARRHILNETRSIRAGDFNLPLNRYIAQDGGPVRFQKFSTGSPKSRGRYMWLETE